MLDEADQLVAGRSRPLLRTAAIGSRGAAAFCVLCWHIFCLLPATRCIARSSCCHTRRIAGTRLAEEARDVQLEAEAHPAVHLQKLAALVLCTKISRKAVSAPTPGNRSKPTLVAG